MTMNAQPTAPAAPVAAPAPEAPAPSLEARADALKAKLSTPEAPSEPAAETSAEGAAPDAGQGDSSAAASDGAPETNAARDARLRRLAEFRERERQADQQREQQRARRAKERETVTEIESLRAKLKDLEPLNDVFSDEARLLAAAEAKGMSAEKLIAWMRTRLSDPAAVAQREAKAAEDRTLAKIAELEKRLADSEKARQDAIEQAEQQRQGIERSNQFVHLTQTAAETHPRVAQFLQRRGPAALIQFANEHVAKYLPEEFDLPELHDHFETFLEAVAGGENPAPVSPASGTSLPPKKHGAEQPVTTLSGALASERTTVAEEIPLSRLSLDERAERLKAKLARG
jgi:hypothetical protein